MIENQEYTNIKTFNFMAFLESLTDLMTKMPNPVLNLKGPIVVERDHRIIGFASLSKQDNVLLANVNLEYGTPERLMIESEPDNYQLCPSFEVIVANSTTYISINRFSFIRACPNGIDGKIIITKNE